MISHIMVPLDGSELAERALPGAERLAVGTGAEIHLVRVVEPTVAGSMAAAQLTAARAAGAWPMVYTPEIGGEEAWAAAIQAADEYLAAQRERLAARTEGTVHADRLVGISAAALLSHERTAGIDLVVMCSHGRSGLVRVALGSVADQLLRYGEAPVLLVRAFGDPVALDQALVPLDGSARAEEALCLVKRLAGRVIHRVTLLRVIDVPAQGPVAERYLAKAAQTLQGQGVACTWRVEQGDAAERIIAAAGREALVVMTTRARGDLLRWALGSVADRVAREAATAVLLVRVGTTDAWQGPTDAGGAYTDHMDAVDVASDQSFPASDPPAWVPYSLGAPVGPTG